MNRNFSNNKEAIIYNMPLILTAVVFILIPVIGTIITSLFRDVTFLPAKFLGVENYKRLFTDQFFRQSMRFTFLFVMVTTALEISIGLVFALVLNEIKRGKGILLASILIPWAIPVSISSRVWEMIYNYDYGILNFLMLRTGIFTLPVNWLGSSAGAFFSLVLADVWKTTPFVTIIILAGLATIPLELYYQSMIDGANFVRRFFDVTLPLLKPFLIVALLFRTIDAIRVFDIVYVLTGGGPGGSTAPLSLYAYKYYLTGDFGYGSAVSVIVFAAAALLAIVYIKIGKFKASIR
jgi:multiple sugar transport system permease protein